MTLAMHPHACVVCGFRWWSSLRKHPHCGPACAAADRKTPALKKTRGRRETRIERTASYEAK